MAKTTNKFGWRLFDLDDNLDLTIVNEAVEGIEKTLTRGTSSQLLTGDGDLISTTNIPTSGSTQPFAAGGAFTALAQKLDESRFNASHLGVHSFILRNTDFIGLDSNTRATIIIGITDANAGASVMPAIDGTGITHMHRGDTAIVSWFNGGLNLKIFRHNGTVLSHIQFGNRFAFHATNVGNVFGHYTILKN